MDLLKKLKKRLAFWWKKFSKELFREPAYLFDEDSYQKVFRRKSKDSHPDLGKDSDANS